MTMALEKTRLHSINIINHSYFIVFWHVKYFYTLYYGNATFSHSKLPELADVVRAMANGNMIPSTAQDWPAPTQPDGRRGVS